MPLAADESFSRDTVAQLQADGVVCLIRYVTGAGKAITASELLTYKNAGMPVCLVMETFAQAASAGYGQGAAECRQALAALNAAGWPADRPIYFVAEDPSPIGVAAWGSIADYFRGVVDVLIADGRTWLPGAYGSGALCSHLSALGLVSLEWHVSTWPGLSRTRAALVQEANGVAGHDSIGGTIDLDSIRPDLADWGQYPFQPVQQEDTMAVRYARPNGEVWVTDFVTTRYVTPKDNDVLNDNGVRLISFTDVDHANAFHDALSLKEAVVTDLAPVQAALAGILQAIHDSSGTLDVAALAGAVANAIHIAIDSKSIAADTAAELARRLAL